MQGFRYFEHTGDLGVELYGDTLEDLFEHAGEAFTDIVIDPSSVRPLQEIELRVEAPDLEQLLVEWLSELIFRFDAHGRLFCHYHIRSLDAQRLVGTARGEVFDPTRHTIRTEVKGATYHQLELRRYEQGWKGRVIFDL
ncbi:MAG: archease [Desulfohalobiaceae bacterium]|nr:archease [Desulfohalobiaceae bacterium]